MSSSSDKEGASLKQPATDLSTRIDAAPSVVVEQTDLERPATDPLRMIGELVLARYRVTRLIGEGGQGVVYEAAQERLKRSVAIKFLQVDAHDRGTALQRFEREAEILAKLSHPSIVQVYDIATHTDGETPFMVMEFVRGESLAARLLDRRRTPWQEAFQVAAQAADALAAAHACDIIHRDIKPDNLLVCENATVKVLDFGIAQLITELSITEDGRGPRKRLTAANTVPGTVGYMSPEQFLGGIQLDGRSDVYSLGVVLYRLISAKRLWPSVDRQEIAQLVQTESPIDIQVQVPELPDHVADVIRRAIERDRVRRFQTMDAFRDALLAALGAEGVPTSILAAKSASARVPLPPGLRDSTTELERSPPSSPRRWRAIGGAVAVLALAGAAITSQVRTRPEAQAASAPALVVMPPTPAPSIPAQPPHVEPAAIPAPAAAETKPSVVETDSVARAPVAKTRANGKVRKANLGRSVDPMHPPKFDE